ncbi:MAG: DUF234 domain-containing protein [Sulfuricurvum sp.]
MDRKLISQFFHRNLPQDMEQCIELFSIFGGFDNVIDVDQELSSLIQTHILNRFTEHHTHIHSLLEGNPLYAKLLHAISVGDRREDSAFRRAHIGKEKGKEAFEYLRHIGYLQREYSREIPPLKIYPKQKFKKEVERHRISHKLRFTTPFLRFWFAFVTPFYDTIIQVETKYFYKNFHQHYNAFVGYIFEELCDQFIYDELSIRFNDIPVESGSYWNREIEIDLLCDTLKGECWIGECKWTNHKRNKKELRHLEEKWTKLSLHPDKIFLFSKHGFSNELLSLKLPNLYLFNAEDLEPLTR